MLSVLWVVCQWYYFYNIIKRMNLYDYITQPSVIVMLALGLIFGSFLNVLIYRLPRMATGNKRMQSYNLFVPRSHCPHCASAIAMYRNIPLLSWLLQAGKASCCGRPISWRYPAMELFGGLLCAAMLFLLQNPWNALLATIAYGLLVACCVQFFEFDYLSDSLLHILLWCALLLPSLNAQLAMIVPHQTMFWDIIIVAAVGFYTGAILEKYKFIGVPAHCGAPLLAATAAWLGLIATLLFSIALIFIRYRPGKPRHE